jgi:hypothetical protein
VVKENKDAVVELRIAPESIGEVSLGNNYAAAYQVWRFAHECSGGQA